jgi:tetratricopeptide (TPR) repeat protein
VALLIASLFCANPGFAGPVERSEELFAAGQASAAKGDWPGALKGFLDAYQAYPRAAYVFRIAEAYEKLGELPRALEAYVLFNQYDPSPEERARVDQEVKRLEDQLKATYAKVFLSSSPEGAFVFVDELSPVNRFRTPVTRWLAPGKHNAVFQMDGFLPKEVNFTVSKGETLGLYEGLKPKEQ